MAEWRSEAACKGVDPALFFPDQKDRITIQRAKAICAECPVRMDCLDYATAMDEDNGIWGGLFGDDLRFEKRRRQMTVRRIQKPVMTDVQSEHGTDAAYNRHIRAGTTPCQWCRDAHAACHAKRKAARRERVA